MDTKGQNGKQRDRPDSPQDCLRLRVRLIRWLQRWGADSLLVTGALLVSAGVGWIYPPAGLIAGGALLITGGVLWARGGDGS